MHVCLEDSLDAQRTHTQKWKQIQLAAGARAYKMWGGGGVGGGRGGGDECGARGGYFQTQPPTAVMIGDQN